MSEITYREAVVGALSDEMEQDPNVFVLGEDVAAAGGVFKATQGLLDRFGDRRVVDTPIAEQAIVGTAIGASVMGLRPVAEIMFADFVGVCFDQVANQAAKYRYMTDGQVSVPLTLRLVNGGGLGFGAQHSQSVENWFLNVPGLKVCVPGTPADVYGLLRAAIRSDDPVLVFEHKGLYGRKGPPGSEPVPLGRAEVVQRGDDVTVVATQLMRHRAVEAADLLDQEGISAEVIDPRTLVPLDLETIVESVARTNHLVIAQECSEFGSWGASVIARVVQTNFESLDAAPVLVGGDDTPIPFASNLESAWVPDAERIADGCKRALAG